MRVSSFGITICGILLLVFISLEDYLKNTLGISSKVLALILGTISISILIFSALELKYYYDSKNKHQ